MSDLSHLFLHVSQPYLFSGRSSSYEEAEYAVIGVPYDRTSTYRAGSRFGPSSIREASANIETYSMRTAMDVEDLKICDLGDIVVADNPEVTMERIQEVIRQVVSDGKIPVMLGGEHTISLGGVKAVLGDITVVDFDAHMDLRNEYIGESLSHASVMRRISEHLGPDQIVQLGTRAVCREELKFAKANHMSSMSAIHIHQNAIEKGVSELRGILDKRKDIYVSVDMDVLDPAYAPAVGNPEADGISPHTLLSLLQEVCRKNVIAIDLTEVTPHYDTGATAVLAARLLFESLCCIEGRRRSML